MGWFKGMANNGDAWRGMATAALMLGLAACGFQPLYGERQAGSVGAAELAKVQIDLIHNREGQMLRNELLDRFQPAGPASKALYSLSVGLSLQRIALGIRTDETATRANVIITANYAVRNLASGDVMFKGRGRSVSGYNVLDSEFATLNAENDATRRAISDLTEQITTRVSLVIAGQGAGDPPPP